MDVILLRFQVQWTCMHSTASSSSASLPFCSAVTSCTYTRPDTSRNRRGSTINGFITLLEIAGSSY